MVVSKIQLVSHVEMIFGKDKPEFDYCSHTCTKNHSHNFSESFTSKKDKNMHDQYNAAIELRYKIFVEAAVDKIAGSLSQLLEGASVEQVTNTIIANTYLEFNSKFKTQIQKTVTEFVDDIYTSYRQQREPFLGKKIPDAVFNLQDFRTMEFYKRSDNFYLGKFITDADTRSRINKWIQKQYFENSLPIGKGSPGINKFKQDFGDVLQGEDFKIRRVIDTTVNKLRNYGAVSYMKQVSIKSFVIRGIPDKLQCPFCASMDGKVMSVETEYEKINTITGSDVTETPTISPFITATGLEPQTIREMSGESLQEQGIGAPAYHPHCKCTIVIEF